MPIHDWTRVDAGLFHDFHQGWTVALRNALNAGRLPADYFALVDQRIGVPIPDVLTLQLSGDETEPNRGPLAWPSPQLRPLPSSFNARKPRFTQRGPIE